MRKHVTPADPKASIPDPERGSDLPPEGRDVAWSVHWARLAASGDVDVSDIVEAAVPDEAPEAPPVEAPPAEPEAAPQVAESPKVAAKAAPKTQPAA